MKEEEIVIQYRMPPIPADTPKGEKEMREEVQRNFGGQVIKLVMKHLEDNGVEIVAARKKGFVEIQLENVCRGRNAREVSVPQVFH